MPSNKYLRKPSRFEKPGVGALHSLGQYCYVIRNYGEEELVRLEGLEPQNQSAWGLAERCARLHLKGQDIHDPKILGWRSQYEGNQTLSGEVERFVKLSASLHQVLLVLNISQIVS